MRKYYIYIRFKNDIGGFDSEIESESMNDAADMFKSMLNEPIMPRDFNND